MTPEEFVEVVRNVVYRDAAKDVMAAVQEVPRGADAVLRDVCAWYNALPLDARTQVRTIAEMAAQHALFGVFCVIDGVRAVETTHDKGEFTLTYRKGGVETVLNPRRGEMLHDLLNAAIARSRDASGEPLADR